MQSEQVILCTGANRSLGFAILQATATRLPPATYILGSRSTIAGNEAVEELGKLGVKAKFEVLELDVTEDESITAAAKYVQEKHGKLDVLTKDLSEIRKPFDSTFSTNISSVVVVIAVFLSVLQRVQAAKVINISSARGSLTRSTKGELPPTADVAYSISKTALNALTIESQKAEDVGIEKEGIGEWGEILCGRSGPPENGV